MSAVRMVAYGVLELKPKEISPRALFLDDDKEEIERERAAAYERDQLRKLVTDELKRYGLLMQRTLAPKNGAWRTKSTEWTLYGQLVKSGFASRPVLHQGDFKACCQIAATLLDDLDKAQIPEGKT